MHCMHVQRQSLLLFCMLCRSLLTVQVPFSRAGHQHDWMGSERNTPSMCPPLSCHGSDCMLGGAEVFW
jgi:hypothetical protein